jgi:HEAT repeat protein
MKKLLVGMSSLAYFAYLTSCASAAEVGDLVKKLKDADPEVRRAAAKELGENGPGSKEAVPDLLRAMNDRDLFVRRFAIQALGAIGPDARDAIPALTKALDDEKKQVRGAALSALVKLGPSAVPSVNKAVTNLYPDVQEAAVSALAELGPDGLPGLSALIRDSNQDAQMRRQAVDAVKKFGKKGRPALPALIEALKEPKGKGDINRMRTEIIQSLDAVTEKGDRTVIDTLVELVANPKMPENLRVESMRALSRTAPRDDGKVLDALRKLAGETDPKMMRVKNAARDTLARMEGKGKK